MTTVNIGSSIKLNVQFYAYKGGPLEDPGAGPTLDILHNGQSVLDEPLTYPGSIVKDEVGVFSYYFTVPTASPTGIYEAVWTATVDGEEQVGVESFNVELSEVVVGSGSNSLKVDYEINYMAPLEPAFIDPDEILTIFPQAEASAVMESIYRASLVVQGLSPNTTADNLSPILYQYLVAAVACDLSQRYGYQSSNAKSITLGDLSVSYEDSEGTVDSSGTVDWCSLAAELKVEAKLANIAPMKGVVKGGRLPNPIPHRSIYKDRSSHYPHHERY